MNNTQIMANIISLRFDMDNYRQLRKFGKVAEIRLEIARLEALLRNCQKSQLTT